MLTKYPTRLSDHEIRHKTKLEETVCLGFTLPRVQNYTWHGGKCSQIAGWQEQLLLHLVSDNLMEIGQNASLNFLSNHSDADVCFNKTRMWQQKGTPTVISFVIFHRLLRFICVEQMFCLRLSAAFAELQNQPGSHNAAHKSFLIYPPFSPLKNDSLPPSPDALFSTS